jgi:probable rRNA maturation factor
MTYSIMGIVIHISRQIVGIKFSQERLKKLAVAVCKRFKVADAIINIYITGDSQMQRLNKKFLHRSSNTDCISFDLSDGRSGRRRLFDFVVNGQMAEKEAKKRGHSVEAELALYIVHCLLHNLGYSDKTVGQARKMHLAEDKILQQQGFGLVYKGLLKRQRLCLGAPNKTGKK